MTPDAKQPNTKRPDRAEELAHERARMLSAESIDAQLDPKDLAWLGDHLGSCADCSAVDGEYRAIHSELRSLPAPEPPRDLWARTSAALDVVDSVAGKTVGATGTTGLGRRPLFTTAAAVGVVVVMAAVSILNQGPLRTPVTGPTASALVAVGTLASGNPSTAPEGPLAVVLGTKYWISANAGVYEIKGSSATCVAADGSCTVATGTGQVLGSIASTTQVSAAIAPDAARAAVWSKDKIAVVPLSTTPQTVPMDQLTPRPTLAATPVQTTPSSSAADTAEVSQSPSPTPSPTAATAPQPLAILSGYEIVGRDPEFSADGTLLAFAARPTDHSTGPDVFLWRVGQDRAEPVTFRDADLFAGWFGGQILISEITAATASGGSNTAASISYVFDPSTGMADQIDVPMLLPALDPTGQYLIYWSGTVEFDPESGLWQPGAGDLYFETLSDLTMTPVSMGPIAAPTDTPAPSGTPDAGISPSPSPSLTPEDTATLGPDAASGTASPPPAGLSVLPQVLPVTSGPNLVRHWVVRWDPSGRFAAIWVAEPGSSSLGRLSLFAVDRTMGQMNINEPLLAADKVMSSVAFDGDHLVYTSAVDGKTYLQSIPAVPPSSVVTPVPTAPGELPSAGDSAQPTDELVH